MAGAIIENMSTRKLCIVGGILLVFQVIAFLVGGLIAPSPTTAVPYTSVKCIDVRKNHHKTKWLMPWGPNQCKKLKDFDEAVSRQIEANDIVFAVHIPLPSKEMSPWFQFMLFIMQLDIAFKMDNDLMDGSGAISQCFSTVDGSGAISQCFSTVDGSGAISQCFSTVDGSGAISQCFSTVDGSGAISQCFSTVDGSGAISQCFSTVDGSGECFSTVDGSPSASPRQMVLEPSPNTSPRQMVLELFQQPWLLEFEENAEITLDVSLAYRDNMFDDWEEIAHAVEIRKLKCTFGSPKTVESEGRHYDCDFLPFMEIGSVAHKYYLINIRLPVNDRKGINVGIGEIKDIRFVSAWWDILWIGAEEEQEGAERAWSVLELAVAMPGHAVSDPCSRGLGIHQNGGFTKVWFAMKTFLTPSILIIMVWYWRRITLMTRAPVLLEKVIFALGISMTFINIPVEWFSIGFDWTWMLLFGDIRQGIFYAMLLSFWIIFCGEHMMDQNERNRLSGYWKQVGPIAMGSFCLFIFDMCERGVQLKNPFYSIWTTEVGTELAMAFIIVAGICLCLYFLFLCFMVFQVFRNISGKQSSLPAMSKARRLHYEGLIFRFKFLMLITLACAAMTVIFFIVSQVTEGHWKWGDITVEVNSAFFTGIYGMWNLYVFALMFLYAPSHKNYGEDQSNGDLGVNSGEELQLTTTITHVDGPTEVYKLARKEAQE
ncbi:hypothetical protein DUI87_15060 [Hirundo rustica rustica]|uniref:Protein wntless homolog n=1 Tax=Hirundo rustica rustica TaxID=333673 RepID=A0A3M0K6M6_HIRRU|nr:hypothetical protein DUI87_15060 [Hirundo rustica rustica]